MSIYINGLAKLTLLDFPGKTAATVFFSGCNMRCPFCHNAPLVIGEGEKIGESEFKAFLDKRKKVLDGIVVTGGEPTLRPELERLLEIIKSYGYETKLDTNGTRPGTVRRLAEKGLLDYVAMDIKNSPEKYGETVGIVNFDIKPILDTVEWLKNSNTEHEFRTTVAAGLHTEDSMRKIGEWLAGEKKYFLQNFKDSGALIDPNSEGVSAEVMRRYLGIVREYIPMAMLRGI